MSTEATTLLKSLAPTTTPNVKSVKVKRVSPLEGPTGLLDGGATHPLRRGTPQELSVAEDVVVELAHGSITFKQHPITGTIFSDRAIEPIVPLRSLIELNTAYAGAAAAVKFVIPHEEPLNVG